VWKLSPVPIKPIQAEVDGIGRYRSAYTVSDLALMLMNKWPPQAKGLAFHRALATCLEALEGQPDAEQAREAFVDAAHEAGISVLPDDAPKHSWPSVDQST
jgi:adenosine/AMP kinase